MSSALLLKLHGEIHVNTGVEVRTFGKETTWTARRMSFNCISPDGIGNTRQRDSCGMM